MQLRYFFDTETLYIKLNDTEPSQTKEFSESVMLELDKEGKVASLTLVQGTFKK